MGERVKEAASVADRATVDDRIDRLLHGFRPGLTDPVAFLSKQFDAGLAWVHFPEGLGGLGLDPGLQTYVDLRLAARSGPTRPREDMLGYRMGAPTVLRHGTPAQQERYLRPAFSTAERWCQLFSEPGAGSDLASLATSARRATDGDWVVNGQKVWSSYASNAHLGMLLARTDPNVPKHQGITFFVVDMSLPRVEVRPLRQITGDAEFGVRGVRPSRHPDAIVVDPRIGRAAARARCPLSPDPPTLLFVVGLGDFGAWFLGKGCGG